MILIKNGLKNRLYELCLPFAQEMLGTEEKGPETEEEMADNYNNIMDMLNEI